LILKMTQSEAERFIESKGGTWDDRGEYVRFCLHCGSWVPVDAYSGNRDICDDCDGGGGRDD
jgi:hypothetical protein